MSRMILCLLKIAMLSASVFSQTLPDVKLDRLADRLEAALLNVSDTFPPLPTVLYQADLVANARYESGKILVGRLQADYHSLGDSLSILYHEYIHHLHERRGEFEICEDSLGEIPQWITDEMYRYTPDTNEVRRDLEQAIGPWLDPYEEPRRRQEIERLKRDLSRSRNMVFVYAPSRLAEAEIDAYQEQLRGELLGLYRFSLEAKHAIHRRIRQLEDTRDRRIRYEQLYQLSPDGCPID